MSPSRTHLESGTSVNSGPIFAITILEDSIFTTLDGTTGDTISGFTFPAGLTIYGNFTTVTLASGKAVLYYF